MELLAGSEAHSSPCRPVISVVLRQALTYLFPILHGLLRIHFSISPDILEQLDATTRSKIEAAIDWVRQAIQSDWDTFPHKRPVLVQLQALADWSPTT